MEQLHLAIPTLFGLEGLAAEELRRLKIENVKADNGRVYCTANAADIPRININLRTGERVQILLGSFHARTFDDLFEGVKSLPWEDYIPKDGAFPVKGHTLNSQLQSEPACQSIIKKAVVDRLADKYGCRVLPESGALYQIQFSLMKDTVRVMLDTTGPGLYKRGYREAGVIAPLRETLAAGIVLLSRYHGHDPFCDPHCGSGTIAIEAALIARNRAPGLNRSFSAQKWAWIKGDFWNDAVEESLDQEYHGEYDIRGGDINHSAIMVAKRNARNAEVDDIVQFNVVDSTKFHRVEAYGRVVTNPPYGERMMEKQAVDELYRGFGTAMHELPGGWQVHVITSHPDFEMLYGALADKKRKLYNGIIKCNLYSFLPKIK